jgi:hypothetical protein
MFFSIPNTIIPSPRSSLLEMSLDMFIFKALRESILRPTVSACRCLFSSEWTPGVKEALLFSVIREPFSQKRDTVLQLLISRSVVKSDTSSSWPVVVLTHSSYVRDDSSRARHSEHKASIYITCRSLVARTIAATKRARGITPPCSLLPPDVIVSDIFDHSRKL